MDCADEINAIQNALRDEKISRIEANLMASKVTVLHDPSLNRDEIARRIESAGVKVVHEEQKSFFADNSRRVWLVSISGALLGVGLLAEWIQGEVALLSTILFVISGIAGACIVFPKAYRAMLGRSLDMNVLMAMAVVGAYGIKQYSEAASVVFLFSLAELLEAFSVARARKAIRSVLSITAQTARVKRDGGFRELPAGEVAVGDIVQVLGGERIPCDGEVTSGTSSVNQAPLTGESVPVAKAIGDKVFAGTVNENGTLEVRSTQAFQDTKISQVIRMVEDAQKQKAPSQRFVDQFAKIYTPAVTLIAIGVCLLPPLTTGAPFMDWFYRALVFLVIACPCALVIATPVAVVSGLTALARNGVLVKGGAALESLGQLAAIALDKTGTITEGTPKVKAFRAMEGVSEQDAYHVGLSLEGQSNHPLAKAVVEFAQKKGAKASEAKDFQVLQGKGAQASVGGHLYFVGNHKLAHELGACTPALEQYLNELEAQAMSVIVVGHAPHAGCAAKAMGAFGLGDALKPNVKQSISELHGAGVRHLEVLSGDNQRTVDATIQSLGLESGRGDMMPEDKLERIRALRTEFRHVGMVGDGINDAPALAEASVGIAMGAMGSDTAIETADVALMRDDLGALSRAIAQGKRVVRTIRFNISFALLIKAVFFVLAFLGYSNLWLAVAADMGASLLVIANSLRLLSYPEPARAKG